MVVSNERIQCGDAVVGFTFSVDSQIFDGASNAWKAVIAAKAHVDGLVAIKQDIFLF